MDWLNFYGGVDGMHVPLCAAAAPLNGTKWDTLPGRRPTPTHMSHNVQPQRPHTAQSGTRSAYAGRRANHPAHHDAPATGQVARASKEWMPRAQSRSYERRCGRSLRFAERPP
ncbi:hypothetical protein RKD05_001481 [Microbacterium sp. SLBN-111]